MHKNDWADDLRDLLEREHGALLSGRLEDVARLIPLKERIAAELARNPQAAEDARLSGLGRLARHNAELLAAARRGLESAQARLALIRGGGVGLNTYDHRGQRADLGGRGRVIRRA
jgi:hypothetical protein